MKQWTLCLVLFGLSIVLACGHNPVTVEPPSMPSLVAAKNPAVGTQSLGIGLPNRLIGSYTLTASPAEGVAVSTVTITTGGAGAEFKNLRVVLNGAPFGSTSITISNSTAYTFSGALATIGGGRTVAVDVYADVLLSATPGTKSTITTLSGCTANGAMSLLSISCSAVAGQDVVLLEAKG